MKKSNITAIQNETPIEQTSEFDNDLEKIKKVLNLCANAERFFADSKVCVEAIRTASYMIWGNKQFSKDDKNGVC